MIHNSWLNLACRMQIKQHFHNFQAAIIQFTRIPIKSDHLCGQHFTDSVNYLPLVGLLIGALAACPVVFFSDAISPTGLAWLLIILGIVLTGAIHEDGLADCCDGLFGGSSKQKRLDIMKDSTLGTYGVLGLIAIVGSKVAMLSELPTDKLLIIFILAHGMSRLSPLIIMLKSRYTEYAPSVKMTKQSETNTQVLLIIAAFMLLITLSLLPIPISILLILITFVTPVLLKGLFEQKIGGYNGDCLGATQQITETLLFMTAACYY
ncbi:MAG: adenosylcobinamide-GDP ribazoletransferase [Cellvibrionales bacterium]|nr:adenosylcobinamide-GDP ribazoletransferase [Cellvibrionales bacterium]